MNFLFALGVAAVVFWLLSYVVPLFIAAIAALIAFFLFLNQYPNLSGRYRRR